MAVSIRDFASSNPRADYDAIVARFGTPHQIAASCLEDMDTDELLDDLRIKRKIVGIVATIAMAVFLLWFGAVTYATVESSIAANGFAVVEVNEVYDDITNREISK